MGTVGLLILLLLPTLAFADDLTDVEFVTCYDGDTCTVNLTCVPAVFGRNLPVRLRGIDAPEINGKCDQEKAKAMAAREYLKFRMKSAKALVLTNAGRDKYFRLDVTIMADGVNLNDDMVAMGFARTYDEKQRGSWCP